MRFLKSPMFYVLLLVACTFALSASFYRHFIWDEAVYIAMGKWLYSDGAVGLWEWIRPIGFPAVLGIGWLLGMPVGLWASLVMLLFTSGSVFMTYLIARRHLSPGRSAFASLLMLVTPVFYYNSLLALTDIPAVFFCLLALYMLQKKSLYLSGLSASVAFLFRYPAGLIVIALSLILLLERRDSIARVVKLNIPFAAMLVCFFAFSHLAYGNPFGPLLLASEHQSVPVRNLDGLAGLLYYPYTLLITNVLLALALLSRPPKTVWLPLTVFLAYFTFIPHKVPRFAVLFLPYIAIMSAMGLNRLKPWMRTMLLLLLLWPIVLDIRILGSLPKEEPGIVKDYESVLGPVRGPILTSDPVPAAYIDKRFIHYYNSLPDAHAILDRELASARAIIYTPASFPCHDRACNESRAILEQRIRQDSILIFNTTWWGESKEIYLFGG